MFDPGPHLAPLSKGLMAPMSTALPTTSNNFVVLKGYFLVFQSFFFRTLTLCWFSYLCPCSSYVFSLAQTPKYVLNNVPIPHATSDSSINFRLLSITSLAHNYHSLYLQYRQLFSFVIAFNKRIVTKRVDFYLKEKLILRSLWFKSW